MMEPLIFLLLGLFFSPSSALEVNVCSRDTCQGSLGKPCPVPNDLLSGERHHVLKDGMDCFCFCGLQEGQTCESDNECDRNTRCMFETQVHPEFTKPSCVSRCSTVQCNPDHRCEMQDGMAQCIPVDYKCSDTLKTTMVSKKEPSPGPEVETKIFRNDCLRVMENRKLELEGAVFRWVPLNS